MNPRFNRPQPSGKFYRINQYIRAQEVRVIDANGEQLGVFSTAQALEMARTQELDLVEVSPLAQPPVCRIVDFGKWQYQQNRLSSKNKTKKVDTKVIRISLKIGQHDIETKQKQARKFLEAGHKAKIELRLKGREKAFRFKGKEVLENFLNTLGLEHKLDKPLEIMGGTLSIIITKK